MSPILQIVTVGLCVYGIWITMAEGLEVSGSDKEIPRSCSSLCGNTGETDAEEEHTNDTAPCDNFYTYVCEKVESEGQRKQPNEISPATLKKTLYEKIEGLLKGIPTSLENMPSEIKENDSNPEDIKTMAKELYQVCTKDKDKNETGKVKVALLNMLNEFGISEWPLAKDTEKNLTEIIIGAGLRPFSTIDSVPNGTESSYILTMNIPFARFAPYPHHWEKGRGRKKIRRAYKRLLRAVLRLFKTDQSSPEPNEEGPKEDSGNGENKAQGKSDVHQVMRDIVDVERHIAKIIRKAGPDNTYEKRTVKEWQERLGKTFPFSAALKTDFYRAGRPLDESTEVALRMVKYFEKLVHYFNKLSPKKLLNYVGWFFVREVADVLTVNIRQKLNKFLKRTPKPRIAVNLSSDACIDKLIAYHGLMENGIAHLYLNNFFNETLIIRAKDVARHLNASCYFVLDNSSWMQPSDKEKMKEWLTYLEYHMGASITLLDAAAVQQKYDLVKVTNKSSLVSSVFAYRENIFLQRLKLAGCYYDKKSIWPVSPLLTEGTYVEHYGSLEMPAGALQEPIFMSNGPMWHNLGSMGSLTGEKWTFGLSEEGRMWNRRRGQYNWTKETKSELGKALRCLKRKKTENIGEARKQRKTTQKAASDPQRIFEDNGEESVLALKFRDHVGLRSSFNALRNFILECSSYCEKMKSDEEQNKHYRSFFRSYAKSRCGNDGIDKAEHRVNFALRTYREFWSAFNCSDHQRMKSKDDCHIMPQPPKPEAPTTSTE